MRLLECSFEIFREISCVVRLREFREPNSHVFPSGGHTECFLINKVILIIGFCFLSFVGKAQNFPQGLQTYHDACLKMIAAIDEHDKYALYDVQESMDKIEIDNFVVLVAADDATKTNTERPDIMFTAEGVDTILAHDFELVQLDSLSLLRKATIEDAGVYIHHAAIAPNSTLTWQSEAVDDCAMIMVWHPDADVTLTVTDLNAGQTYNATPIGEHSVYVKWTMPADFPTSPNFSFSITNRSDKSATFVVAMNV